MRGLEHWWRSWEITIDSNWIEILAMAILFVASGLLLLRDARHLIYDNFLVPPSPVSSNRFDNMLRIGGAAYLFVLAFAFRPKFLKLAFALAALDLSGRMVLSYFHAAPAALHQAAMAGSILRQLAYTIFLVVTVQWFTSVTRWVPPQEAGQANSSPPE